MQYSFLLLIVIIFILFIVLIVIIYNGYTESNLLIFSLILNVFFLVCAYIIKEKGFSRDCGAYPIYKKILLSNLLNNVKSGDLLLFNHGRCNIITRTMGNPYYSHIGMIVNKDNKFYTLELIRDDNVYPKQERYKDMILIPLEDRITNYSGSVYHCSLINKLSKEEEDKLINYYNPDIKYSMGNSCCVFIAKLIEHLNIATNINSIFVWDILNNIINLCDNTIYRNPINIVSDKLLIDNIDQNEKIDYC